MCGIVGIVPVVGPQPNNAPADIAKIERLITELEGHTCQACITKNILTVDHYLGGDQILSRLAETAQALKTDAAFFHLFTTEGDCCTVSDLAVRLQQVVNNEHDALEQAIGQLDRNSADIVASRLEKVRDICWCLGNEVAANVSKTAALAGETVQTLTAAALLKKINTALNSLDRLEVRGRDSAGISIMLTMDTGDFDRFQAILSRDGLWEEFSARSNPEVLVNNSLSFYQREGENRLSLAFVYKFAAEIGSLGDNIAFLRKQIRQDMIFQALLGFSCDTFTISAHTRWASVGTITEANCHPVDSRLKESSGAPGHILQVALNGDIDNFQELKAEHEAAGEVIPDAITTDTKIIPLRIEKYLKQGNALAESFRLALNDFTGAHAISLQTDLAPGKLFFAQRGSGQALFIGLAEDYYIVASELYGIVEETDRFIKMNAGERDGQIVCLNLETGGISGITVSHYDGAAAVFTAADISSTEITSRDVDRQGFPHYFLKEISEAPRSIENTLHNSWKINSHDPNTCEVLLDETVIPAELAADLSTEAVRRIFFIGQGTAGVAALAAAEITQYYLGDPAMSVCSLKSSELSGFNLQEGSDGQSMTDTLVVAISQSGTTTDTNRALDMVRKRGARTLAIVNRRDSDITFKVDGVFYTSTGRDIEMSVASTKAFYAQVVAGALLGLYISGLKGARSADFITQEIKQLLRLPNTLTRIFQNRQAIRKCARRLAGTKTYWATVGSGPNKASSDEIRIKLSELCYKTISSDFVENKKHIDLSAEPLILVCAAGARPGVVDDIVKDTAIFRAHKAAPVVITDEGEERFRPYAEGLIPVPPTAEHFGPVVNTFAGHLWGYYAALAINEGSRMLSEFRDQMQREIEQYRQQGLDLFEIVLENEFREKVLQFYNRFRQARNDPDLPVTIAFASDLALLLKYLSGRLPLADFELDFGRKGTAPNMIDTLFDYLGRSINQMARPVDAIKHQAKTVTVGTSRITEAVTGLLFEALEHNGLSLTQLTNSNIVVLKNVQEVVATIKGSILYEVDDLNLLGVPTDTSTISLLRKEGSLQNIPSRVETDNRLKGTKKIIVREGNVYIGKGRKDDRHIVIIPVLSSSPATGGMIRNILLLNIALKKDASLFARKKALGGKFERIKNYVQENSLVWQDKFLDFIDIHDLFGKSAEKIAETIIAAADNFPVGTGA